MSHGFLPGRPSCRAASSHRQGIPVGVLLYEASAINPQTFLEKRNASRSTSRSSRAGRVAPPLGIGLHGGARHRGTRSYSQGSRHLLDAARGHDATEPHEISPPALLSVPSYQNLFRGTNLGSPERKPIPPPPPHSQLPLHGTNSAALGVFF